MSEGTKNVSIVRNFTAFTGSRYYADIPAADAKRLKDQGATAEDILTYCNEKEIYLEWAKNVYDEIHEEHDASDLEWGEDQ